MLNKIILPPLGKYLVFGSRPKTPITVTLFKFAILHTYFFDFCAILRFSIESLSVYGVLHRIRFAIRMRQVRYLRFQLLHVADIALTSHTLCDIKTITK